MKIQKWIILFALAIGLNVQAAENATESPTEKSNTSIEQSEAKAKLAAEEAKDTMYKAEEGLNKL